MLNTLVTFSCILIWSELSSVPHNYEVIPHYVKPTITVQQIYFWEDIAISSLQFVEADFIRYALNPKCGVKLNLVFVVLFTFMNLHYCP